MRKGLDSRLFSHDVLLFLGLHRCLDELLQYLGNSDGKEVLRCLGRVRFVRNEALKQDFACGSHHTLKLKDLHILEQESFQSPSRHASAKGHL